LKTESLVSKNNLKAFTVFTCHAYVASFVLNKILLLCMLLLKFSLLLTSAPLFYSYFWQRWILFGKQPLLIINIPQFGTNVLQTFSSDVLLNKIHNNNKIIWQDHSP